MKNSNQTRKQQRNEARRNWGLGIVLMASMFTITFCGEQAGASGSVPNIGPAVGLVEDYRGLLEDLANPTDAQINSVCAGNQECNVGLKNDASMLRQALQMFDRSARSYRDNEDAYQQGRGAMDAILNNE